MKRKNELKNEKGLTLVEVLAALVLIGIVFIGFMLIFPQMTLFNEKTTTKLETMNLAKQELAELKDSDLLFTAPYVCQDKEKVQRCTAVKNGYQYEVDYFKEEDLEGLDKDGHIALHKVYIKIKRDGSINSETYGYIIEEGQ